MNRALWLFLVAGCIDKIDERWQLDHDHVVAARATPPRIRPGETTNLDALVAHVGRGVSVENPLTAEVTTPQFAEDLAFVDGSWVLTAPSATTLAAARPAMNLPEDAPVPVDIMLTFASASNVKKTVWLGEPATNPELPPITIDGQPAESAVVLPIGRDVYLEASTDLRINWLTSVGALFQDDERRAFIRVAAEDRGEGELVVVARDSGGGVVWQIWPVSVAR